MHLVITDTSGLADTCQIQVSFVDDVPPTIQCPPDLTLECGSSIDPADTGMPTASGDCEVSFAYSTSYDPSTGCSCVTPQGIIQGVMGTGTFTRKWIATDSAGNADTCYQRIFLIDTQKLPFTLK